MRPWISWHRPRGVVARKVPLEVGHDQAVGEPPPVSIANESVLVAPSEDRLKGKPSVAWKTVKYALRRAPSTRSSQGRVQISTTRIGLPPTAHAYPSGASPRSAGRGAATPASTSSSAADDTSCRERPSRRSGRGVTAELGLSVAPGRHSL
jgi:hypothetical protein